MEQLLNYTNIRMVEGMKSVSEENAKMTAEMKELAIQNAKVAEETKEFAIQNAKMTATMADLMRQNADATEQMKISTRQNADATKRMADLAELNRQQAVQSERQAQSMADLAYDTKRDSEVMKAITIVTLIFLPATFVSVRSILGLEFTTYPLSVCRQSSAWVSSILDLTRSGSPGRAGYISLAPFRSLSSSLERHLYGYGGQGQR